MIQNSRFHISEYDALENMGYALSIFIWSSFNRGKGIIKRDEDDFLQINLEEDDALARLQAGAATYRFTVGPNKGKKAFQLKTVPETDHNSQTRLVATHSGFSLHAGVAMAGTERDKIEKLCRYIARPARPRAASPQPTR